MTKPIKHPAKFSDSVLDVIAPILKNEARRKGGIRVLDPFAGVGKVHLLATEPRAQYPIRIVGVELEPEWANQHPNNEVGDALNLRWRAGSFDAIVTSPVFGNRMSDSHDAKEKCRPCKGTGKVTEDMGLAGLRISKCEKCEGEGRREYKRNTYKHTLGRDLTEGSSAVLQWGPSKRAIKRYQEFHLAAWEEARRVLNTPTKQKRDGGLFVLNISDHIRDHEVIPVAEWHRDAIIDLGFRLVEDLHVETPRFGEGENYDARVPYEHVFVFRAGWRSDD